MQQIGDINYPDKLNKMVFVIFDVKLQIPQLEFDSKIMPDQGCRSLASWTKAYIRWPSLLSNVLFRGLAQ